MRRTAQQRYQDGDDRRYDIVNHDPQGNAAESAEIFLASDGSHDHAGDERYQDHFNAVEPDVANELKAAHGFPEKDPEQGAENRDLKMRCLVFSWI